jgi:hypothetical protein
VIGARLVDWDKIRLEAGVGALDQRQKGGGMVATEESTTGLDAIGDLLDVARKQRLFSFPPTGWWRVQVLIIVDVKNQKMHHYHHHHHHHRSDQSNRFAVLSMSSTMLSPITCCHRCSLLNTLAIFLAAAVPWSYAFASFPRAGSPLVPSRLLAPDMVGGGRKDFTHHRRAPPSNMPSDKEDLLMSQMEFSMNDIQSPPTPASTLATSTSSSRPVATMPRHTPPETAAPTTTSPTHDVTDNDPVSELGMDRTSMRLDGLEVYAIVSTLNLATSIQLFEVLSQHWHWGGSLFEMISDVICVGV